MNLFYLDTDIDRCAEAHVDDHVGKMQLEITQMICANLWVDDVLGFIPRKVTSDENASIKQFVLDSGLPTEVRYKPSHINHPCTIWMRSSFENWEYSVLLVEALNQESMWRGRNSHKSCALALRLPAPKHLPSSGFTTPALAMLDDCKMENPVESYRKYYRNYKSHLAKWTRRGPPSWWSEDDSSHNPPWNVT